MLALKRVKEISNLARGSKAWCRAKSSYAASVPCDAPKVRKTRKRLPIGKRHVMVESFVNRSVFCLSPAGDTPSSARLFDAIVSGCIPVIISDELELPFEGILDYRKIAIFVSSNDAVQPGWLLTHLRSFTAAQLKELRMNLGKVCALDCDCGFMFQLQCISLCFRLKVFKLWLKERPNGWKDGWINTHSNKKKL